MESTTMPNVLLVMTDQHRAGFTRGTGFALDTMPFLDSLGRDGTVFENAYTSSPLCVPARLSMLTGRFPSAHRVRQNSTGPHAVFEADMLDVLRARGYRLGFSGKPHIHRPLADFDAHRGPYMHDGGAPADADDAAFDTWLHDLDHGVSPEPTPFPLERQLPHRIVSGAMEVIDELGGPEGDDPFFCWVSFPEPHNPYQVPEPYFSLFGEDEVPDRVAGREAQAVKGPMYRWLGELIESKRPGYDEGWRRYRASYCGMLRLIDDQLRRLVEHLGDRAENTVIVFLADHGDYVGEYGLQRKGAGLPEALVRIPMQVTGPGVAAGHRVAEPVSIVDVLPTICELTAAVVPAGVQGRSLAPVLAGEPAPEGEFSSVYVELGYGGVPYRETDRPPLHFPYEGSSFDELNSVTMSGGSRMVREGDHKLVLDVDGRLEMYDLREDPAELDDRADDPALATVRDALLVRLARWSIRVSDDLPNGAYDPRTAAHNWRWAPPTSD